MGVFTVWQYCSHTVIGLHLTLTFNKQPITALPRFSFILILVPKSPNHWLLYNLIRIFNKKKKIKKISAVRRSYRTEELNIQRTKGKLTLYCIVFMLGKDKDYNSFYNKIGKISRASNKLNF